MRLGSKYRQSGLTIVELMVALLIASILIAGIVGLFLGTRKTRTTDEHMNKVATNSRFFTTFVSHDIRMAGYRGRCSKFSNKRLAWSNSNKSLTVRYCKKGSIDTIKYFFNRTSSSCTTMGGASVCYLESNKSNSRKQLINGLKFQGIWFGEQNKSGNVTYKSGSTTSPTFSNLETVRLRFKVPGNNLTAHQLKTGQYAIPDFDFVVGIRNNKG